MQDNITRYTEKEIENILIQELGVEYKRYRKLWNSIDYDNIPSYPVHIDFELNDKCNQSCIMCPRNIDTHPNINYKLNNKTILSFSLFKEVIDEGKKHGLKSINVGAFAEPLLNKDVFKMVKYANENGIIDTRLITNGLLLDKYIDDIFSSKLVNLFVSIDAFSEESYLKIRGKGFSKIKNALDEILLEKEKRKSILPIIRVSFVDMGENQKDKNNFIEYWKDKVDFIDIQVFDNYNIDINADFNMLKNKKWDCYSPFARLSVLSNGDVLPCCNFFGRNISVGNIYDSTIKEIWNSQNLKQIREGVKNDTLKNCSICQRIG